MCINGRVTMENGGAWKVAWRAETENGGPTMKDGGTV